MKRFLNTLFVTTQKSYLSKDSESVCVKVDGETKLRIPVITLGGIICFGNVTCSPFLMGFCAEHGVSISFLSEYGRFLARVEGPISGNVLLRREQYRKADDKDLSTKITMAILTAKFINSRAVIQRAIRDHGEKVNIGKLKTISEKIKRKIKKLPEIKSLDLLRGYEGEVANNYFSVFNELIIAQKNGFKFESRNRRPPLDNVNSLLSFVYTLLMHDVRSAIESVGLDAAVGFLHRDRPGRYSLALDLMEEFRSVIADRLVLSLINREQVKPKGFKKTESGAIIMDNNTRKEVLISYQKRKKDTLIHPFLKEKVKVGVLFHLQALLMSRFLRGDIDNYPPFIWR